jgi:hypothetical protein
MAEWTCRKVESFSDHKYITFKVKTDISTRTEVSFIGARYIPRKENYGKFDAKLAEEVVSKFRCKNNGDDMAKLDAELSGKIRNCASIDKFTKDFYACTTAACNIAFHKSKAVCHTRKGKTVPWWTENLTVLRKRINALCRRYQRTLNDVMLRNERKNQYLKGNREYLSKLQKERTDSWNTYCTLTDDTNTWNAVYKIAGGKNKSPTVLKTIQKQDGTFTEDTVSTLKYMLHYFSPEDNESSDSEYHQKVRKLSKEPLETEDDKIFFSRRNTSSA